MSKEPTNSERMFSVQAERDWTDEDLGMRALAFIFDPDELGKGREFVEFLERDDECG